VIFRPAGIYGPGDLRFLKVFRGIQKGRFPMFGSGEVTYQFTYIDDLVEGIILCGEHPAALGGVFILCADGWVTLNEFFRLVADAVGGRPPRIHWPIAPLLVAAKVCETVCTPLGIDPPLHTRRCEFYTKARAFSNARAKATLGFQPGIGTAEGIRRTARWYAERGLIAPIPASAPAKAA
jgi:nucleoside-diphosphate-sugar epimerase